MLNLSRAEADMTRTTNARLAGIAYIVYIVAGISSMALAGRTHAIDVLTLITSMSALVLGVTLYAITRDENHDLAMLAMMCRVVEAIPLGPSRSAFFFAVGSTIFCWLLLRGRMIPSALAWLGVVASAFLVVVLPLQTAGLFASRATWYSGITWFMWMPMLVFELAVAGWFIVKGVAAPTRRASL
jgi:uncharacterized protein DUF4386